ncbi:hypothetical protein F5884DRAFT_39489 [Xylogone sp. PMI_703]|nr:hypothetical protein F5884DRAFT_39489 [Xylogone sp. PMI_703]
MFIYFPELPTELRLSVWQKALAVPRVVGVKIKETGTGQISIPLPAPTAASPVLFQVNREARTEAKKVILPLRRDCGVQRERNIYASPKLDTIWLSGEGVYGGFFYLLNQGLAVNVSYIAISYSMWTILYDGLRSNDDVDKISINRSRPHTLMLHMQRAYHMNIREIAVVINNEDGIEKNNVIFVTPEVSPFESGITKNRHFDSWRTMEKEVMKSLEDEQNYENRQLLDIQDSILSGSDLGTGDRINGFSCSRDWTIPTVKFVKATW